VHAARHLAEVVQAVEEALGLALHRRERAIPTVFTRDELLQDPECRVHLPARVRVPARKLRDVLEVVLRQEAE